MGLNKKSVDDLKDLKGRRVLVRCDFNVPLKDGPGCHSPESHLVQSH